MIFLEKEQTSTHVQFAMEASHKTPLLKITFALIQERDPLTVQFVEEPLQRRET